jgi:hypothetical protein
MNVMLRIGTGPSRNRQKKMRERQLFYMAPRFLFCLFFPFSTAFTLCVRTYHNSFYNLILLELWGALRVREESRAQAIMPDLLKAIALVAIACPAFVSPATFP